LGNPFFSGAAIKTRWWGAGITVPKMWSLLKKIHHLLYSEGYTIKGVQKLLKGVTKAQLLREQGVDQAGPLIDAAQVVNRAANQHGPVTNAGDTADRAAVSVEGDAFGQVVATLTPEQRTVLEGALTELRALETMVKTA
jgi:hypothetical protein